MAEEEIWKAVKDWPYEVSSLGRVRRSVGVPGTRKHRICAQTRNVRSGYLYVMLSDGGQRRNRAVHILVCEAFHGARPSPICDAAHGDGSRANNVATNLRWATRAENMGDALKQGTFCVGTNHWSAKLSANIVRTIRSRAATGENMHRIAEEFGIWPSQVCRIVKRQTWAWLSD